MSTQNKHTAKAIGLSLLITIFAFFNMDSSKPYTQYIYSSYLLLHS